MILYLRMRYPTKLAHSVSGKIVNIRYSFNLYNLLMLFIVKDMATEISRSSSSRLAALKSAQAIRAVASNTSSGFKVKSL